MQLLQVITVPFVVTATHIAVAGARSLGGTDFNVVRLDARQSNAPPIVPAQCKATCDPVNSVISGGTCPVSQCCTPSFETGYFNCIKCVGGALGLQDFSFYQGTLDRIVTDCSSRGLALPKLTFPGQNSARPLSTLPLTGSATRITSLSLSRSAAPNTTTRINPPITPVGGGSSSSSSFTQMTITALPTDTGAPTVAPVTSASGPTPSGPSTSAGVRTIKNSKQWVIFVILVAGGMLGL